MQRDFDRITKQLEAVCNAIEDAAANNQVISIGKACKVAKVSHSWICKLIDESNTFKIPEELIERFEYAKCLLFDVIIQEVNETGQDRYVWDEETSKMKYEDAPMRIARSKLRADNNKWLYSRLMPRLLGDKVSIESTNTSNTNVLVVQQIKQLDVNALKQIASMPLIEQSNNNDR